ncbi:bacterioferritin [Candidatus Blochmannia ocreatus (nom. nud.)]|uniref:Bacterioferritin n=1 Tax=Candidatus Blochmannia ocreatus (nom. nud.) TaxID=251538 RepID=A0ABY4STF8_9ENTR|nr:bacterioferritin [Candidatus Blochmannia ocreatus]URJ25266.1 bacterioferritin [Candidatus Blochmannia ocreatus]
MKGDNQLVTHLNNLLSDELIAVNHHFLHAKIFENLGLERLNNIEKKEYIEELHHADLYAQRILFLEQTPMLRTFEKLNINKNIEDILRADLDLEYNSINSIKNAIKYAESILDYISRDIMIQILSDEEKHVDFIKKELDLIISIGMENYIQSQLKK